MKQENNIEWNHQKNLRNKLEFDHLISWVQQLPKWKSNIIGSIITYLSIRLVFWYIALYKCLNYSQNQTMDHKSNSGNKANSSTIVNKILLIKFISLVESASFIFFYYLNVFQKFFWISISFISITRKNTKILYLWLLIEHISKALKIYIDDLNNNFNDLSSLLRTTYLTHKKMIKKFNIKHFFHYSE